MRRDIHTALFGRASAQDEAGRRDLQTYFFTIMQTQKKTAWIIGIVLAAVIIIALAIFLNHKPSGIVIGVSLPLTGPSAGIGERVKAAFEIAQADIAASGGPNLNLVIEDDKGDPTTAVTVAHKLVETDGARIILGELKSDPLLAVAPYTEANKVLVFSPTAGADAISTAGDFVFRNIEKAEVHGRGAAAFFAQKGVSQIALFTAQASNAESYGTALKNALAAGNPAQAGSVTVVSDISYKPDQTDFHTDIAKAKASGADGFYLAVATAKDAGLLVRQIRESGFQGIIMASVATDAPEFFQTAGASAEGTYITASYYDETDPANAHFKAEMEKKIPGNPGDGFAANGYDALELVAAGIRSCSAANAAINTACIRDFLYSTKNYPGIGGMTSFDQNGDVVKPVMIKVAQGGAFVKADMQ